MNQKALFERSQRVHFHFAGKQVQIVAIESMDANLASNSDSRQAAKIVGETTLIVRHKRESWNVNAAAQSNSWR